MSKILTCQTCGFATKPTSTPAAAAYAMRKHSCAKHLAAAARRARAEARRAAADRTPKPCLHPIAQHQHGTYACYVADRCNCPPCSAANATYERRRIRLHAYGTWNGLVDAEPARLHVKELMAGGLGLPRIAHRAGLAKSVLINLIYGRPHGQPSRRIRPATADALLAVPIPAINDRADGAKVRSTGATHRIRALQARGWPIARLADAAGVNPQRLYAAANARPILVATHRIIADLYERLWDQPPPETSHRERIAASRARRRAAQLGWAPPLAWDDDSIDDPAATPDRPVSGIGLDEIAVAELVAGRRCATGDAEKREAARILAGRGATDATVADRLGVTPRTVQRWGLRREAS